MGQKLVKLKKVKEKQLKGRRNLQKMKAKRDGFTSRTNSRPLWPPQHILLLYIFPRSTAWPKTGLETEGPMVQQRAPNNNQ